MISNALTAPVYAWSPDADRVGPGAPAHLMHRIVRFLVLVAFLVREHWRAISQYCAGKLASWWYCRSDLPPGSLQQRAAPKCGAFGNAIDWTRRRRGIGARHSNRPMLSRAIVAYSRSIEGFRPGLPSYGLPRFETPNIVPGMIGETVAPPSATAMASLLSRREVRGATPPAPGIVPSAETATACCLRTDGLRVGRNVSGQGPGPIAGRAAAIPAIKFRAHDARRGGRNVPRTSRNVSGQDAVPVHPRRRRCLGRSNFLRMTHRALGEMSHGQAEMFPDKTQCRSTHGAAAISAYRLSYVWRPPRRRRAWRGGSGS